MLFCPFLSFSQDIDDTESEFTTINVPVTINLNEEDEEVSSKDHAVQELASGGWLVG